MPEKFEPKFSETEIGKKQEEAQEMDKEVNIESQMEKEKPRTVLEIGCGFGFSPFLEERNIKEYRGAHIIHTDISGKALEGTRDAINEQLKELERRGDFDGKVEVLQCDARQLPFVDHSIDELYAKDVFGDPSIIAKEFILKEAARVLGKGGEFIITEFRTPGCAVSDVVGFDIKSRSSPERWQQALTKFTEVVEQLGFRLKARELLFFSEDNFEREKKRLFKSDDNVTEELILQYPFTYKMMGYEGLARCHPNRPLFTLVFEKESD